MFQLIDKLAGEWLDKRRDAYIKKNYPEMVNGPIDIESLEIVGDKMEFVANMNTIGRIAEKAAQLLLAHGAKNYIEIDLVPRMDRQIPPVRLTVRWAKGLSPARKAMLLQERVKELEAELATR